MFEHLNNSLIAKTDYPLRVEIQALGLVMNVYLLQFEGGVESSRFQSLISYQVKSSDDYTQQSQRSTQSLAGNTDPLILVDGVPFPDAQSISALDPSMIDRVEAITRATPQYGSRGSNGVIAIYTKSGFTSGSERNYLSYKIPGYDKPRSFFSPNYSDTYVEKKTIKYRHQLLKHFVETSVPL